MAEHAVMGLVSGLGDYKVKKNVLLGGNMPKIENHSGPGGITVQFQEYLGDITTPVQAGNSSPFDIKTYLINPAVTQTFPWLSQIAANFEQYEIEGMLFGFRTTSADMVTNNSNNLQLGTVIMATQYDVADAVFASKAEMLNYEFASSVKPSEGAVHMIECDPRQTSVNLLYTSPGPTPAGTDPRLYHLGRFAIATQGFQGSGVTIGELHITYQVRLLKPKLWTGLGQTIPFSYFTNQWINANTQSWMGPVNTISLGGVANGCGITFTNLPTADDVLVNIPGNPKPVSYLFTVEWLTTSGAMFATTLPVPDPLANCAVFGASYAPSQANAASTRAIAVWKVTTSPSTGAALFQLGVPTQATSLPPGNVVVNMQVTVVDPDFVI